jgi:ankyrin repeat protein
MSTEDSRLLPLAAWDGDLRRILELLDAGVDIDSEYEFGISPLHAAIENSQPAALELLLSRGADPNLANSNGWTPLAHAIELELDFASGRQRPLPELSAILIQWGSDPDMSVPGHGTIRNWVERVGYVEVARLLPPIRAG